VASNPEKPDLAGELLSTDDLEAQIGHFIEPYNHHRYHESLENLTPADVYFGRGHEIIEEGRRIKRQTLEHRRLQHLKTGA
jgi:putative transposase